MSKKYIIITLLFCASLLKAQTTEGKYAVKNIKINTEFADFGASYYGADSVVFTSPRSKKPIVKNIWKPNKQPYLDLYIGAVSDNGEIIGKHKVKGRVNTKFHEAMVTFTKDLKTVYFTGNNFYNNIVKNDVDGELKLQLFKATVSTDGQWADIIKLPFNDDQYSTGHPALSEDNKKLYFISDRSGSIGETDIYVVDINSNGTFSEPKNLGSKINTKGKEMFPFIIDDIIYYSSDGYHGYGGLDIFASKLYDNSISDPLNMGTPINSANDDFAFILKQDKGYFSSNRKEGMGDDDIYSFRVLSPLKIECTQFVSGIVKNKDTQKILAGVVVDLFDDNGSKLQSITTNLDGTFNFKIACNSSYKIIGDKTDFEKDEKVFIATNDIVDEGINVHLDLAPKKIKNKRILNINPIYFDLNKSNIRPDAAIELDKVVDLMKENPDIIVESRSHTDARGYDKNNLLLSDRRAKSTVEYIISKGIDSDRISGKGFGETDLLNECSNFVKCSKAKHQINRRTEFYIIDYKE